MEGKNLWKKSILGSDSRKEESIVTEAEVITEDTKRDLELFKDRMDDPESVEEDDVKEILGRLILAAENNPQVKAELERYSQVYKEHQGDVEEEPNYVKNSELYERVFDWSEKQRLGNLYPEKKI